MNEPWIYLVLLGAVIAVFGWLKPKKESNWESFQRNMEDTLEHYVDEIAADNEKVLQVVEKLKQEHVAFQEASRRRMDKLEAENHILSEKLEFMQSLHVHKPILQGVEDVKEQSTPINDQVDQEVKLDDEHKTEPLAMPSIRTRYQAIFELLDQGVEASAVAEQLQLPLGEVQLIAKLALQEEKRV